MRGSKHKPTDKTRIEVASLRSFGHTHDEIASYLDICPDTLEHYYRRELDTAVIKANAAVANRLYQRAIKKDDLQAQIFWLKTRGRWRTQEEYNLANENDRLKEEALELRKKLEKENEKEY